jgi:hypothetical protein
MAEMMNIQSIPEDENKLYEWYEDFESKNYGYTEEGKKIAEALANEFAERWYPWFMKYHGTQYYYSLFDDFLLQTLRIPKPHFFYRYAVKIYMWIQLRIIFQLLPDPSDRNILDYYTGDYPDYHISKVGPFPAKANHS